MRWDLLLSVFSDWRLQFLAGFVLFTILVAGILTLAEQRIRRNRRLAAIVRIHKTFLAELAEKRNSNLSAREKLDFIDTIAKNYFAEQFGTPVHSDYSYLKNVFEKEGNKKAVTFCDLMFSAYYLKREVTKHDVENAFHAFVAIYREHIGSESYTPIQRKEVTKEGQTKTETQEKTAEKKEETKMPLKEEATTSRPAHKEVTAPTPHESKKQQIPQRHEKEKKQHHSRNWLSRLFTRKHRVHQKKKEAPRHHKKQTHRSIKNNSHTKKSVKKNKQHSFWNLFKRRKSPHKKVVVKQKPRPIFAEQKKPKTSTKKLSFFSHKHAKKEERLEGERSKWLKHLQEASKTANLQSTGTYGWLSDVRKALNIK